VSEATFYPLEEEVRDLGVSELRRLRQLEDENNRRVWSPINLD
jgi:hypothetical protein